MACVCVCACLHACEQSPSCLLCPPSSASLFCFCLGPSLIASHRNHGCEVIKVEFLIQRFKKFGHFLTVTKDGILQFWSESFVLVDSFKVSGIHMWSIHGMGQRASAFAPGTQAVSLWGLSACMCSHSPRVEVLALP